MNGQQCLETKASRPHPQMKVKFILALTEVSPVARRRVDDRHIHSTPSTNFLNQLSQNPRAAALSHAT
jgi:hypothetical protein